MRNFMDTILVVVLKLLYMRHIAIHCLCLVFTARFTSLFFIILWVQLWLYNILTMYAYEHFICTYIAGLPEVTLISSSHNVEVTRNVTFTVIASGVGMANFTYQWRHNLYIITNETGRTLTIVNAMESDRGVYICLVTNFYGKTVSSNPVILNISSKFILKVINILI